MDSKDLRSTHAADVLLVEDDHSLAAGIISAIRKKGLTVDAVENAEDGRSRLGAGLYRVVLLDLVLPKGTGLDIIDEIRSRHLTETSVVVITGGEPTAVSQIDREIVKTVLFKPLNLDQLAAYVHILSMRHA